MKASDIARVEAYLRSVLRSSQVHIDAPRRRGGSVEVRAGDVTSFSERFTGMRRTARCRFPCTSPSLLRIFPVRQS